METNASDYAFTIIFSIINKENKVYLVAFHSHTFTIAELNYDIYDKKFLAIFEAFKMWQLSELKIVDSNYFLFFFLFFIFFFLYFYFYFRGLRDIVSIMLWSYCHKVTHTRHRSHGEDVEGFGRIMLCSIHNIC